MWPRNDHEYKGHTISPLSGTLQVEDRYGSRWYIECMMNDGHLDASLCPRFRTLDEAKSYIDMCRAAPGYW